MKSVKWWQIVLVVLMLLGTAVATYCCVQVAVIAKIFLDAPRTPYPVAEPVRVPPPVPTVEVKELRLSLEDYPRVDGSTSTQPLAILVACKALGVPYRWRPSWTARGG